MSIFNQENENKKIKWPEFNFKTGKKIEIEVKEENNKLNKDQVEQIEPKKEVKEMKKRKEAKKEKLDEILKIPAGAILRIDGEEYQIHIPITPGQEITKDYIHKKVTNPNGVINKWEYKNAELKYDSEDNIFYYVIESPKKG